jgi:hypothetical protein
LGGLLRNFPSQLVIIKLMGSKLEHLSNFEVIADREVCYGIFYPINVIKQKGPNPQNSKESNLKQFGTLKSMWSILWFGSVLLNDVQLRTYREWLVSLT